MKDRKRELFGEIAIRLGFVKLKDVQTALKTQESEREKSKDPRLIGLIMLDMGVLGTTELIAVLKEIESQQIRYRREKFSGKSYQERFLL